MSDLLSGQIHFTGLGSGTDFSTMIDKIVDVERTHIRRLQSWKQEWSEKIDSFQELNTKLLGLRTSLSGMDTRDKFLIKTAASTNADVLSATAGSAAAEGSHEIIVNQLARNAILTHIAGETSTTTDITGSTNRTFAYTYKGTPISVDVPSGTTLDGLVDLINKDADNPGVRTSTIFDGSHYHLQIRGMDLGADNTVTIDPDTLTWFGVFETSQAAANAQLRVDGFPSTGWIERSTNTISDVIAGVTLSLKSITGETPITIIVGRDDEAIKEQVRTFVSQVNEVLALTRDLMKVDQKNSTGSILTGNYGVQIIQQNLKLILAGKGLGFDYDRDPFVSLSSIGIRTDADEGSVTRGELLLDESALQAALDKDAEGLASLFSASSQVLTDSPSFVPAAEPLISGITKPGSYEVQYELDDTGNIVSASIGGVAAIIDHTSRTITGASGDSRGLSLEIRNTDQGAHSGMAYIQQGKAGELIDQLKMLTDPTTGTLNILEKNYHGIMNNIDIKIDFEEARLVRRERDLRHRFSRLESLLGYYDQLTSYLSSQIGSLSEKS